MSPGRYCCKSLFAAWDSNSPSRRCDDWMTTWGTASQRAKLMGDSGIGFEALSTGDCRLFRSSARNWPRRLLGFLQQYRHKADVPVASVNVRCWGRCGHRQRQGASSNPHQRQRQRRSQVSSGPCPVGHIGSVRRQSCSDSGYIGEPRPWYYARRFGGSTTTPSQTIRFTACPLT
jgi:hypothetical protein